MCFLSSSPWSVARILLTQHQAHCALGQDALLHGKILFVIPATDSDLMTFPLFTQDLKHLLLWPCVSHRKYEVCIHHHFNGFLTASGWKGAIQLHLVTANPRRHHKKVLVFLMVLILTRVICRSLMSKDTVHFFPQIYWSLVLL